MKKLKIASLLVGFALVLSACSDEEEKKDSPTKTEEEAKPKEPKVIDENASDKSDTISKDKDIQKEVEAEEGVSQVSLTITEDAGGFVLLDFEVDSKMKKEKTKEIANKYADQLKEKYKDSSVDVQARKGGEKFVQVTLENKK